MARGNSCGACFLGGARRGRKSFAAWQSNGRQERGAVVMFGWIGESIPGMGSKLSGAAFRKSAISSRLAVKASGSGFSPNIVTYTLLPNRDWRSGLLQRVRVQCEWLLSTAEQALVVHERFAGAVCSRLADAAGRLQCEHSRRVQWPP